jgi:hypothetical protein
MKKKLMQGGLLCGNEALKWLYFMEMETIHLYVIAKFVATYSLYMLFLMWATC